MLAETNKTIEALYASPCSIPAAAFILLNQCTQLLQGSLGNSCSSFLLAEFSEKTSLSNLPL